MICKIIFGPRRKIRRHDWSLQFSIHNFGSSEIKAWKQFRPEWDTNPCMTSAISLQQGEFCAYLRWSVMSSYYFQLVGFLPRERCNSNLTVIFLSGICTTQVNTVFTVSDWLTRTGVSAIHFRAIILKFRTCLFIVINKGILCAVVFQPV